MIFKKKIIFVFLIFCAYVCAEESPPSPAKAQTDPARQNIIVQSIHIETQNNKLKTQINNKLVKYQNKPFSKKLTDEIHSEILSALKKYKILLPKTDGPVFTLEGREMEISYQIRNPYRYGFILKGNRSLDRYKLLPKKAYWQQYFNHNELIRKTLLRIRGAYLKTGYANVVLAHQAHTDEKNFIKTIVISIKEGRKTKIEGIKIFGRFFRPDQYYVNFLRNYSGSLIKKNLFYNPDIQKGVKNLINFLKNEGYLKASAHTRIKNTERGGVVIELILNEGPLTLVKAIHFKGNQHFSRKQLLDLMKIKPEAGLNINYLERDIQELIATYRNAGFLEMTLNNKDRIVYYDKKDSSAELRFDITENKKIKVFNILVQGNKRTKKEFIINSLSFKIGDILTPKKTELAINTLRNTGVFSSIDISLKAGKQSENRTVVVQVEERKPRSLRFALGINTERSLTARGFAEFSHRNIAGTGRSMFSRVKLQSNIARYVSVSHLEPKYPEHQAVISYVEPFLFGFGFNGQVNLSNSSQIFSHRQVTEGEGITDIVNSTKINFMLKRKISTFINLTWTLLSWESRTDFKTGACLPAGTVKASAESPSTTLCESDTLNIATTGVLLSVDKRNDILSASDGFLSQMLVEYSGPLYIISSSEKIRFIKMEVKHFDFRPLFNNWTWANSVQGGFITNINNFERGGFPVSRIFILGGVNSLRGFDGLIDGERVPDKEEFPIEDANELIFSRSSFYLLLKTELRFSFSKNFTGTLFYDGGIVTISGKNFTKPYRHSTGVGLRYKTPLGPVAGYIALKISPRPRESRIVPHLSFGSF